MLSLIRQFILNAIPRPHRSLVWLLVLLFFSQVGCVQRRLTIRSFPPGAMVYIDKVPIGVTPISTDYIYYGTREFRLVKDGYQTVTELREIAPPWYQYFPIDFVAENVVPGEIRDQRTIDFQLAPQMIAPTDEILQRAENLRRGSRVDGFAPTPGPLLIPPPPVETLPPAGPMLQDAL